MTIVALSADGSVVSCVWFDGAKRCDADFPAAALVRPNYGPPVGASMSFGRDDDDF